MEGLQKLIGKVSKDPPKLGNSSSSSSSSFDSHRAGEGLAAALSSSDQCRILFNRPARDLFATNKCALEMEKWDFPKIGLVFLKL
ncbi:unnamed protein product [Prunus armeniaca]|uniref:Uncharacterized protein n=1 Tax=Prunus armeniaca TaxID=36596 RepID=A0A6J5VQA5_PRUAR|nr:unnamed protein product [Prunus armeniaca]